MSEPIPFMMDFFEAGTVLWGPPDAMVTHAMAVGHRHAIISLTDWGDGPGPTAVGKQFGDLLIAAKPVMMLDRRMLDMVQLGLPAVLLDSGAGFKPIGWNHKCLQPPDTLLPLLIAKIRPHWPEWDMVMRLSDIPEVHTLRPVEE